MADRGFHGILSHEDRNYKMFKRRAVFLDRDGTVIESIIRPGFVKEVTAPFLEDELKFVPDAYSILRKLRDNGFLRILATNQPDVAHEYMEEVVWQKIQKKVEDNLDLDAIKMCRHTSLDNCPNKKPLPGMLFSAADDWGIDLRNSFMVGDTDKDMKAGRAAGCRVILITHKYNEKLQEGLDYDYRVSSLADAVEKILELPKLIHIPKDLKDKGILSEEQAKTGSNALGFEEQELSE